MLSSQKCLVTILLKNRSSRYFFINSCLQSIKGYLKEGVRKFEFFEWMLIPKAILGSIFAVSQFLKSVQIIVFLLLSLLWFLGWDLLLLFFMK